ncbi:MULTISPECIES: DUF4124 domain-containing protein [Marinobacter]|uniref:DUF4124 domain-containing protein n=1 Tax=Marinobacter segnicrescens TaxID=430453 RepID=A0A1I0GMK0_9GAMM|nr:MULTISPECIES: DUF4124 domain-containing protein [Marinobacter]UZD65604.1 DUF4124 domain-containing protein [Marinobacter sp. AN1]SET72498.1 protein of unknown function [Marinobacter segnicrescens]
MNVFLLLLCLLATPVAALAGTYRWVDENGQTHFGDRPPAGAVSDEVKVTPAPVDEDAAARARKARVNEFLEQSEKQRAERNEAKARQEAAAEERQARCEQLRGRLKYLKSVSKIYRINNDGERVYVDDEENERLRREFTARVQSECGA